MEVIATKPGFYGQYRNEGDKFDVPEGSKATWFEPTKKPRAKKSDDAPAENQGE